MLPKLPLPPLAYHGPHGNGMRLTTAQIKAIKDMTAFNVTLPTQSMVTVRPNSVKAGAILDTMTVTYTSPR